MTDKRINKLKRKLQEARYRLLTREPELAAPLVEMLFVTNVDVRRMSTNGSCIYFDASWLEKLDEQQLGFCALPPAHAYPVRASLTPAIL